MVFAVASKSLWKEFVLINVDESEYDTEMSEDDEFAKPLVPVREVNDDMKSLMNEYEVKVTCGRHFARI